MKRDRRNVQTGNGTGVKIVTMNTADLKAGAR